jgi:hypothetical protein
MKFYEIIDPISGHINVHGSEFESEGEVRKEWIERHSPEHQEKLEPRKIKVREMKRNELAVPEQMDSHRTPEEIEEICQRHRDKIHGII